MTLSAAFTAMVLPLSCAIDRIGEPGAVMISWTCGPRVYPAAMIRILATPAASAAM